jgi:hypothetical protein
MLSSECFGVDPQGHIGRLLRCPNKPGVVLSLNAISGCQR